MAQQCFFMFGYRIETPLMPPTMPNARLELTVIDLFNFNFSGHNTTVCHTPNVRKNINQNGATRFAISDSYTFGADLFCVFSFFCFCFFLEMQLQKRLRCLFGAGGPNQHTSRIAHWLILMFPIFFAAHL